MKPNTPPKKILVVDDDEQILVPVGNILRRANYRVISTTRGKEAVELARKLRLDLIILDIILPDISGDEVAVALAKNPSTASIPIIFLTVIFTKQDEKFLGKRNGKHYMLAKPATRDELLEMVDKVLSSQSLV